MNTLNNHFKEQLKRAGKKCTINNNICVYCFFKEIKDKEYIDTKYMFIDKDIKVKQGDIIDCLGQKWIVIQQQENYNNVYSIYTIRRLNNRLNFKFGDGVYPIDVIVEDSIQTISGDIPIGEGKIQIITQSNNITKYLKEQIRFILYNRAYEIEAYTQTEKNIIKFYCKKTQIQTSIDDTVNNIAFNEKLNKIYINSKYEIITDTETIDLKENESKVINIEFKKNNVIDASPNVNYIFDKKYIIFDKDTKTITGIKTGNTDFKILYNNVEKIIKINVAQTVYKIEVTQADIKLNKGETATIDVKFYKDNMEDTNAVVEYISDNSNIAIVEKGVIQAVGAGNTTIVIKYNNLEKVINVFVEEVAGGLEIVGENFVKYKKLSSFNILFNKKENTKDIKVTFSSTEIPRIDNYVDWKKDYGTNGEVCIIFKDKSGTTPHIGKKFTIKVELDEDKNIFTEKEVILKPMF
ncbi:hypothetical protein ACQX0N_09425 [Clostridium tepidum]